MLNFRILCQTIANLKGRIEDKDKGKASISTRLREIFQVVLELSDW
jgi:hypothetical protein